MNLRLGIHGACGRMGVAVGRAAAGRCEIAAAIEHPQSPHLGKLYGNVIGRAGLRLPVTSRFPDRLDAVIDFSSPQATASCVRACRDRRIPLVVCTTGLSPATTAAIRRASRSIACLVSSNMSVGVNLLFRIVPEIARTLGDDFDIEIVEAHHRRKKDAPSGTAMTILEKILTANGKSERRSTVFGRKGDVGERRRGEIGLHAVRYGGVVGEHRVIFGSDEESIEIVHRALTRDLFASGALKAAEFVARAKPGLYSMNDVLAS